MPITCTSKTEHYATGKKLLEHYDLNEDGVIERQESIDAGRDYFDDKITKEEVDFVVLCYDLKSIDAACEAAGPDKCVQHVKVLDVYNQPISYATVQCNGQTVETDLYGITGFSLDEGKSYTVNASKAGYVDCEESFTACTPTITLVLNQELCTQRVQVKDDKDNVIEHAKVIVDDTTKYTDRSARCSFKLVRGAKCEAVASKTDYVCLDCKKTFTACTRTIKFTLKKSVPTTAPITFDSSPKNATVHVDGVVIGNT